MAHVSAIAKAGITAGITTAVLAIAFLTLTHCSPTTCTQKVKSDDEAKKAIAAFFTSNGRRAQKMIEELRRDGMTDEYLGNLQGGCRECYTRQGYQTGEDPTNWYVIVSIAPQEAKKIVVLEVECADVVWLDHTLYGG